MGWFNPLLDIKKAITSEHASLPVYEKVDSAVAIPREPSVPLAEAGGGGDAGGGVEMD